MRYHEDIFGIRRYNEDFSEHPQMFNGKNDLTKISEEITNVFKWHSM